MPFRRGENVGPYRIVQPLGQGGMASVFKGYHPALDRYVAIKVLHPAFLEDPNFLARFQREARVVAKLDHPNIVPIYDYAEHDGQPYLVMKFIPGRTLKAVLEKEELPNEYRLEIVGAAGEGLAYAHERGVLHRDIKPSNILLEDSGGVYLADFGLARIAQAGESTLSSDMLLGTPQYISPEQARGEQELDEGTDIYSFGVVMYEMVVGQVPYNADTPFSIIHDHIYSPLPLPSDVNPEVSEPEERVLLKALAKDRDDRFASVDELVAAYRSAVVEKRSTIPLETLPDQKPDAQGSAGRPEEAITEGRDRRWWLWPAAGLMMTFGCLGVFLLLSRGNGAQGAAPTLAPTTTRMVQATVTSPPPTATPSPMPTEEPSQDPAALVRAAEQLYEDGQIEEGRRMLLRAADLYMRDEQYLPAAGALRRGMEYEGGPRSADPLLVDRTVEALFFGAESGMRLVPQLERLMQTYPGWPVLQPIAARTAMHADAPEVDQMRRQMVDGLQGRTDPLAMAVLAEDHLMRGEHGPARDLANRVLQIDRTSAWLAAHLEEMLDEIPAG